MPLSPSLSFHPATPCPTPSTPFTMQEKGSRLCTCFVTSVPLRLRRLDHVSSNSPRERHFQPCYQHLIGAWWTWGWGGYRLSELVKTPLSSLLLLGDPKALPAEIYNLSRAFWDCPWVSWQVPSKPLVVCAQEASRSGAESQELISF